MSTQPAISMGHLDIRQLPVPRLQLGGKRPPYDFGGSHRLWARGRLQGQRRRHSRLRWYGAGLCALGSALATAPAYAASLPDLSGVYRCEGNEDACKQFGSSLTVTQSGQELQIRSDKGATATAKLTSDVTLTAGPDWNNMHALIRSSDRPVIVWANGAAWRKQQITATN